MKPVARCGAPERRHVARRTERRANAMTAGRTALTQPA